MPCGCHRNETTMNSSEGVKKPSEPTRPTPTSQCLYCAQKHADEALAAMREYTYEVENRSFVHGALRSIVLHTYKDYKDIASVARNAALKWQEGRYSESEETLIHAIKMIYSKLDGK